VVQHHTRFGDVCVDSLALVREPVEASRRLGAKASGGVGAEAGHGDNINFDILLGGLIVGGDQDLKSLRAG